MYKIRNNIKKKKKKLDYNKKIRYNIIVRYSMSYTSFTQVKKGDFMTRTELSMNEWTVTGEIFYLKELEGEFAASFKLRGTSTREGAYSTQILEFPCLMQKKVWEEAKKQGVAQYKKVTFSGHIESWLHRGDMRRIMFIVDYVIQVK